MNETMGIIQFMAMCCIFNLLVGYAMDRVREIREQRKVARKFSIWQPNQGLATGKTQ